VRGPLLLGLLTLAVAAEPARPLVHLADGRVLYGRGVQRTKGETRLETDFGALVIPDGEIAGRTAERPPSPPETVRVRRTRWFEITSDLSPDRERLYADQLDAFFEWMIGVYALDVERVRRDAPYGMRVFRRRADFKKLQAEVAPDIDKKGSAFAEGVAGFYAPGLGSIYLWDVEGESGEVHLEVAKHETSHLCDDLLARQVGIRIPTWFTEGAATYFSMFVAGGAPEPEVHPGALAQVLGDLDGSNAMRSRELRSVKWELFHGREYSWGWAQVHFVRHHAKGARWKELIDYLRTIPPMGPVTDSEERRFLKAMGFPTSEAFDRAWHDHLKGARRDGERGLVGTSPEVLARVNALAKPDETTARNFARIGLSLARVREASAAVVYLRAALRGGVTEPEVAYELSRSLALAAHVASEEARWPDDAFATLQEAVKRAPLRALYRRVLGLQLLARGDREAACRMLGLALLLAGPADDDLALALAMLRASATEAPEREVDRLCESSPPMAPVLRRALPFHLQATEDWGALFELLRRRDAAGGASAEERALLAGLHKVNDEIEEALAIYRGLVSGSDDPRHWPDIVECLLALGRTAEAKAARAAAYERIARSPREHGAARRRLERIEID